MATPWLGIGSVVTEGGALYYHSALLLAFDPSGDAPGENRKAEAVVYSTHGINGQDLACIKTLGIQTLALLQGLHDVRI
jgi:hypothetical protein